MNMRVYKFDLKVVSKRGWRFILRFSKACMAAYNFAANLASGNGCPETSTFLLIGLDPGCILSMLIGEVERMKALLSGSLFSVVSCYSLNSNPGRGLS